MKYLNFIKIMQLSDIANIKGLWRWFIIKYIHNLDYVRVIQTSKIFHCLTKKEEYIKYHNRWIQLNDKECVNTYIKNARIPSNNDGGTFLPTLSDGRMSNMTEYPKITDVRWMDINGKQICGKCKCLSEFCSHSIKYLKTNKRGIVKWDREQCYICKNFKVNKNKKVKDAGTYDDDGHFLLFDKYENVYTCINDCKEKKKFYGYEFYTRYDYNYSDIYWKQQENKYPSFMSKNMVLRIGVRNRSFGTIKERDSVSYIKYHSLKNRIKNKCLFEGRGWQLFKAKYDELRRMLNPPCESCGCKETWNHICECIPK
jgi:hypothetical protein